MKRKKIIQNKFTVAVGAFLSLFTIMSGSKLFPPVRLGFSANSPCLFGKGIIMPFG